MESIQSDELDLIVYYVRLGGIMNRTRGLEPGWYFALGDIESGPYVSEEDCCESAAEAMAAYE